MDDPQTAALDAPPTTPESTAPRGALLTVFLVVFIDLLGFGIVLPLLPRIAEHFLEGLVPGGAHSAAGGATIGLLYSSFSAMQFLFAPLWGRASDRVGRRPILLIGLVGSVVFYALFGFASGLRGPEWQALGLALLFVSRIGAGIAGATISTAAAVIADCTPPQQRARGMALIGAAFGIGFTFGPLLAFAAWFGDLSGPGYLAAGLSFVALLIAWRLMPETRRVGAPSVHRGWLNWHGLAATLRTPTVGLLVVTFFLATFGFANFEGTLALLTEAAFGFNERTNFLVFAYVGASLVIAQGVIYRRLALHVNEVALARAGVVMMLLGLVNLSGVAALAGADDAATRAGLLVWFFAALAVAVTGFAFLNPSVQSLISRRSDPGRQGEVLGVNQSASALARILGPAIGNVLFPLTVHHELPYLTASALLLAVLLLTPRLKG
jgi:MFS family permease